MRLAGFVRVAAWFMPPVHYNPKKVKISSARSSDAADGRFGIDPITADEAGIFAKSITETGCIRILPSDYLDIGGVDGFFIARLLSLE